MACCGGGGGHVPQDEEGYFRACKTAEVPASHGLKVKLPGVTVAIFKTEDRYVVMKNACAHQGGDLSMGDIEEYEGLTCIKCPQHQYKFDLKTGKRVLQGGELTVPIQKKFRYKVVNDEIWVKTK